jgi:DNA-binding MarR family transcriptional regulator
VYLTPFGKSLFKKTKPVMKKMIVTMEQNISDLEKHQIIEILKKVQNNFNSEIEPI